ncbi:hypothetical protein FJ970_21285 [Mesorhizobium sp. B2-1-8]|uniref:hypothetical protein n=1 Tax=Mesorhizobium sp. B2-1-8 TaxID=2589967 RepID=UPI00112B6E45|nr:hypothetical protein [Mesorhizobium sp. B2-1-8]UCI17631.1 hypothetical protein FJ970_21285 [Mesorhizobium sp. B2-1-8]
MTKAEIERDITPDEAYRAFDTTIMHVSPEVAQRVALENEAAESSSTDLARNFTKLTGSLGSQLGLLRRRF